MLSLQQARCVQLINAIIAIHSGKEIKNRTLTQFTYYPSKLKQSTPFTNNDLF